MLSSSKLISSIDRELRSLVTGLDECATRLLSSYPNVGLIVYKVPDRLILQAGNVGVSISLFRSRSGMAADAEIILALWQGQVTIPGSSSREGHRAKQLRAQQFRITASGETDWLWKNEETTTTMTSLDLAATCIGTMAEQLQARALSVQDGPSQTLQ